MSRLTSSHSHRRPAVSRALLALATATAVTLPLLPSGVAHAAAATPRVPVELPNAIEGFSPYVGQQYCDPVVRPGVAAFRAAVLRAYPGSGDYGIVRDCDRGGTSEHKEGRAWDWRVNAAVPSQNAAAQALLSWLLAKDAAGNPAAMARRLGIMYIIWDGRMWRSYRASAGWLPFDGASRHSDHVHFSFSWEGALHETSFFTGTVAAHRSGPPWPLPLQQPTDDSSGQKGAARPVGTASSTGSVGYPGYPLKPGATGPAVSTVQRALGLPADGKYGANTDAAVTRWQQAHGLTPDGDVGPITWRRLFGHTGTTGAAGASSRVGYPGYPLKPGATGPAVSAVQRALGLPADGKYGANTDAAVTRWQQAHGLTPDGDVGPITWQRLFGQGQELEPVSSRKAVDTLMYGSRGGKVTNLQKKLGIPASGWFGPLTRAAVVRYQTDHGLTVDGMAGPETRAALGV